MSPGMCASFEMFRQQWDKAGVDKYGTEWPDMFCGKMQAVLDVLDKQPDAFNYFVYDEFKATFGGSRAFILPGRHPMFLKEQANR